MSGTSSTLEREAQLQPVDSRISEEIELERFHARAARLREEIEASRIRAQQWEHRAEYFKRRTEEAQREISRIQGSFSEAMNTWRANVTSQAFASVLNQAIHERADVVLSPEDIHSMRIADDESTSVSGQPSMKESNKGGQDTGNPSPYDPNPNL